MSNQKNLEIDGSISNGGSIQQSAMQQREDGEGDAFMTNVKTGLVNDTEELPIHKQKVNIMDKCVNNIENQFESVLKNHEEDFMAAYRGHMTKVKKELTHLKKKAEDAAGKLSNDDNITKLQKSIKWFQGEAKVLDQFLEGQKREVQKLKTQKLNTQDDNRFLKQQVKDAMKHNKLLEVANNKTQRQCDALRQFLEKNKQFKKKSEVNRTGSSRGNRTTVLTEKNLSKLAKPEGEETKYNFENYQEMENETNIDEAEGLYNEDDVDNLPDMDQQEQDQQILANLNILKDAQYQVKQMRTDENGNEIEESKVFFTQLPQTQDELEQMSIVSADYNIGEYIMNLFDHEKLSREEVQERVLKFFSAYDASRELNVLMLKRKLDIKKKNNQDLRTFQAHDYAEKADIENLFLDCVDQCKREHFKQENATIGLKNHGKLKDGLQNKPRVPQGVNYSLNGTIREVNLDSRGKNLKSKMINDKNALINIFQEMFGSNKAPLYETDAEQVISGSQGIDVQSQLNIHGGVAVGGRAGEAHPAFAKSMQKFNENAMRNDQTLSKQIYASGNPLKMIKEYKTQNIGEMSLGQKGNLGKNAASSIDHHSNASTKDMQMYDEVQRYNKIMQEPIENLITNMDLLSRPVSSKHVPGFQSNVANRYSKYGGPRNGLKKERAMTAHNKTGLQSRAHKADSLLKIAQSAYHINNPENRVNNLQRDNLHGFSGNINTITHYGGNTQNFQTLNQNGMNIMQNQNSLGSGFNVPPNIQSLGPQQNYADGMMTMGSQATQGNLQFGQAMGNSRVQSAYPYQYQSAGQFGSHPMIRVAESIDITQMKQGRPYISGNSANMQGFVSQQDKYNAGGMQQQQQMGVFGGQYLSHQTRVNSANPIATRKPNIRLGSGSGPSSNIFSVKNGKLMLTNKNASMKRI